MNDEWQYGLRTINRDRTSGCAWRDKPFEWPPFEGAPVRVEAPDWDPARRPGGGIHVLHRGTGDANNLDLYKGGDAIYQVVRYRPRPRVALDGLSKVPWVDIIFEGSRASAVARLIELQGDATGVVYAALTGGDYANLVGGDGATLTAGRESRLTGGHGAILTAGFQSVLRGGNGAILTGGDCASIRGGDGATLTGGDGAHITGGDRSILTGGTRSVLTGGRGAILTGGEGALLVGGRGAVLTAGRGASLTGIWVESWKRIIASAVVSDDGPIKPDVPYRVDCGKLVEARAGM